MAKVWAKLITLATLMACQEKIDASKNVADSQDLSAGASTDGGGVNTDVVMGKPDILLGQWSSDCIANPANSLVSGSVAVYEFTETVSGRYRVYSYRDSLCEQRFTKADVDKLKVRLQEQATALGAELSEEELKAYDVLWSPPVQSLQYKIGRKYTNGLTELDIEVPQSNGQNQIRFLSFYIEKGELFFAESCMQSDAQLGSCGPVAGDSKENRGKKIDFNIAYSFKPLVKPPEQ